MSSHRTVRGDVNKRRRSILIGGVVLLVGLTLAWRVLLELPHVARHDMDRAFSTLRTSRGELYARELTRSAEVLRDSTLKQWQMENERWFFLRDYARVDRIALRASNAALAAARRALRVQDSLKTQSEIGLGLLRDRINELENERVQLPDHREARTQLTEADGYLVLVEQRLEDGDFLGSAAALAKASHLLDATGITLAEVVNDYLTSQPLWTQWAEETIAWSKTHRSTALVVDKMAHRCHVYRSGRLIATFAVEMGPEWIGPKRFEGDLSTPEGRYQIKRKRGIGETAYYLALEIDYPNARDRRRFADDKRRGLLPPGARLGGNIELHGDGGKSFNWTRGCIALANTDMRSLYDLVSVGSQVTIVGNLESSTTTTTDARASTAMSGGSDE